ncbi:MAG: class A beta-lactamase-related serine hydrolase [Ignavibacteria bacterium]|nr:class A beta-lactamase-related serine hydrolase [Ignavibacteria bacterium]
MSSIQTGGTVKVALLMIFIVLSQSFYAQTTDNLSGYKSDKKFTEQLAETVKSLGLDSTFNVGEDGTEQISLAVIDITGAEPTLAGFHMDNFIYPASVYKMYVAAAVLARISHGDFSLYDYLIAKEPNIVDRGREIKTDPRPLLKEGDTVTVNYLLDLMITRSDNSAANCLIDKATRPFINNLLHQYGWYGSEVTRKYLRRKFEDPGYDTIRGTETCAFHAADFLYRIYTNNLVNPWVSQQMMTLLGRQLDKSKIAQGLPATAMFYHKTGWFAYWTNDVGIVDDGQLKYVIACFLPLEESLAKPKMKMLAEKIYAIINERHKLK